MDEVLVALIIATVFLVGAAGGICVGFVRELRKTYQ